jgi:uncharacterized membrane protein YgcG
MYLITVFLLLVWAAVADDSDGKRIPKPKGWINDTANVVSGLDRRRLSNILRRYHRETHHQLAVLTGPILSAKALKPFLFRGCNAWGLVDDACESLRG